MKRRVTNRSAVRPDVKLMRSLNSNLARLAMRLEGAHIADYVNQTRHPLKLMTMSFVAGLARGLGMAISLGFVGIFALAAVAYIVYYTLEVFEMIPFLADFAQVMKRLLGDFMNKHMETPP